MASITNCIKTTLKYGLPALGIAAIAAYMAPSTVGPITQVFKATAGTYNPFLPTSPLNGCSLIEPAVEEASRFTIGSASSALCSLFSICAAITAPPSYRLSSAICGMTPNCGVHQMVSGPLSLAASIAHSVAYIAFGFVLAKINDQDLS
jgi:hypothetical protein